MRALACLVAFSCLWQGGPAWAEEAVRDAQGRLVGRWREEGGRRALRDPQGRLVQVERPLPGGGVELRDAQGRLLVRRTPSGGAWVDRDGQGRRLGSWTQEGGAQVHRDAQGRLRLRVEGGQVRGPQGQLLQRGATRPWPSSSPSPRP